MNTKVYPLKLPSQAMTRLFVVLTSLMLALVSMAQQVDTSSAGLQRCLLSTGPTEWNQLQLTPDQLERMNRVQTACREECEATGAKKGNNPISNADGSTVLSEVVNILSDEQYQAWVRFCATGRPTPAPVKH